MLVALDFDGVLVDSAAETALSGFAAAKALWPGAAWLTRRLRRPDQLAALVSNFEQIRPCLETGWESSILLHLLAEGMPNEDIMANFQSGLRDETMAKLNVTKETCNNALKQAREEWIGEDGTSDDWLAAHGFYDGACQSVRDLLAAGRVEDVFVITTKAADFSKRLLQKQQLFGEGAVGGGINPEHIYVSGLVLCHSLAAHLGHWLPAGHVTAGRDWAVVQSRRCLANCLQKRATTRRRCSWRTVCSRWTRPWQTMRCGREYCLY
eukprot:COSAG02_NODE_3183_length_7215_cov_13.727234_2_plen_266_part_00